MFFLKSSKSELVSNEEKHSAPIIFRLPSVSIPGDRDSFDFFFLRNPPEIPSEEEEFHLISKALCVSKEYVQKLSMKYAYGSKVKGKTKITDSEKIFSGKSKTTICEEKVLGLKAIRVCFRFSECSKVTRKRYHGSSECKGNESIRVFQDESNYINSTYQFPWTHRCSSNHFGIQQHKPGEYLRHQLREIRSQH